VGIWFSPRTYYLHWSEEGHAERAMRAIQGPARVMVERSIPYTIVEEEHYDRVLHEISVLFMPRALVTDPTQEEALARFVERGGTLVVESETGAFGSNGLYRYPHERFLSNYFGIREVGRRSLPSSIVPVSLQDDRTYLLPAAQWATPFENGALLQEQSYGAGRIVAVGLYNAEAFYAGDREEAESYAAAVDEYRRFVADMVDAADAGSPVVVLEAGARLEASGGRSVAHVRVGDSNGVPVIFVVSSTPHQALTVEIRDRGLLAQLPEDLLDLLSGETVRLRRGRVTLPASEWGVAALVPRAAAESA
jgi:beta-galactosidase